MFYLDNPERLLILGIVLPLAALLLYAGYRSRLAARKRYGEARLVDKYTRNPARSGQLLAGAGWLAVVVLVGLAIANPYLPDSPIQIRAGSTQVVVVTDVSKSMAAEDYRGKLPTDTVNAAAPASADQPAQDGPNGSRLHAVKYATQDIFNSIAGNQLGLVTYSGEGFDQAPLTTDFSAVKFVLDNWVRIGSAPGGGSDYARGLRVALDLFKQDATEGRSKVIVLFSDGGFTGDDAELTEVLAQIKQEGIRLIIVGVGGHARVPIPVYEDNRFKGWMKDGEEVVMTSLEEANLQRLAVTAGGDYYHLNPDGNGTLAVEWVRALGGTKAEPRKTPLYPYFVGAALALLFVLSLSGISRKRDVL